MGRLLLEFLKRVQEKQSEPLSQPCSHRLQNVRLQGSMDPVKFLLRGQGRGLWWPLVL